MKPIIITWDYYQKNKGVVKAIARRSEPTRTALNFLKNHKFTWVKELIYSKKKRLEVLKKEYFKPENKDFRNILSFNFVQTKKEIEYLRSLQLKYPEKYVMSIL